MPARARFSIPLVVALFAACSGGERSADEPTAPPGGAPPGGGTTTGTTGQSYQFGAKFEPPAGRVVHGVGQWQEYNLKYSALLPATSQPASQLIFMQMVDSLRPWNPANLAAAFAAIDALGRIPLADFAPRGGQPTPAQFALLPDPYWAVDNEVANSTKWDSRIQDLANVLKAFKKPVLLRIGGEMNGWWNGYHPYDFPKAFRKIVNMVRAAGASNVAFVWCYEPAGPGDFDEKNANGEYKWYPGADVVDWFSIDFFADVDISGPTSARGTLSPFGRTLKFLDMALAEHKPVTIAESGPQQFDLTKPAEAASAWTAWFTPYFALISSRAEIKWFMYVNYDWTKAAYYANQGWKNSDLSASPTIAPQYIAELANAKYLHAGEKQLLKDYALYK
jgi:hypothetical protein